MKELHNAFYKGKNVDIEYAQINGDIDFGGLFYPHKHRLKAFLEHDDIAHIEEIERIDTRRYPIAIFNGVIRIQHSFVNGKVKTSFGDGCTICIFNKEVDFYRTQFKGREVGFYSAKFNSVVNFDNTVFNGYTNFRHAQFKVNASFQNIKFNDKVDFGGTLFNEGVSFFSSIFPESAYFGYAIIAGKTDFDKAQFNDCYFNGTLFGVKSNYTSKYLTQKNLIEKIVKEINIKDIDNLHIGDIRYNYRRDISPFTYKLIEAYRLGINSPPIRILESLSRLEYLLVNELVPETKAASDQNLNRWFDYPISFTNTTFSNLADFREAIFLKDVDFSESSFKEIAFFDGSFFFNAKKLGFINRETEDSVINLNIDNCYFNFLKGIRYDQIFPNLPKRLKYYDKDRDLQLTKNKLIENYIYVQENFRKNGRFEDADLIYAIGYPDEFGHPIRRILAGNSD